MTASTVTVASFSGFTADTTSVVANALSNTPGDFGTMNTVAMQAGVAWASSNVDDTMGLNIRIVSGATILAAADAGGTFQELEPGWTNTTSGTTNVVSFVYVNLTANQTAWDAATVEVQQTYSASMKSDGGVVSSVGAMTFDVDYDIALTPVVGDLAVTEGYGPDTFVSDGGVATNAALAVTESYGPDTFVGSGVVPIAGDLITTEPNPDTAAFSGTVLVAGDLSATETGSDSFAGTGQTINDAAVGDLAVTETGSDTFAGSGVVPIVGTLAATETGSDTMSTLILSEEGVRMVRNLRRFRDHQSII